MENFDILNSINNPLVWIGMAILVVGSILRLLPIKALDKAQVERLLHKFLNLLIFCGFIAAALGIYFSKPENEPVVLPHGPLRPPNNELADEQICQSLIGKYKLLHEYDYVFDHNNDDEIAKNKAINISLKSKTIKGYWDAIDEAVIA